MSAGVWLAAIWVGVLVFPGIPAGGHAGGFEGVIAVNETSEGAVTTQRFYFKGEKVRLDDGENGFTVWDARHREGFYADPEDKSYTVMSSSERNLPDVKSAFEQLTVTKTGKSEKIAGHACEVYLATDTSDGSTSEFCLAKGLSNAALYAMIGGGPAGAGFPAWFHELTKDGGFPLRTVDRDKHGKEESRSEATQIESKRLDESVFAPPVGFRRIEAR